MRAPICVDSAHEVIELEKHNHLTWNLNDLHGKVEQINSWTPGGKQLKIGSFNTSLGSDPRYTELAALNFASAQGVRGATNLPKSRFTDECAGSRSRIQRPDKSGVGNAV